MQKSLNIYFMFLVSVFFYLPPLFSQSINDGFNFYLPPTDTANSEFISLLPDYKIGTNDFVTVDKEGHFSVNGKRIRFWGANLVAGGAFPSKNDAWFIAGRLRKMGFNLIRFHHLDNPWGNESLFQYGQDTRHLNPTTLDNLEYLIYQLKNNGIRANINLNVSRAFNSKDGVAGADSVANMFKGVTVFDPQLIYLEKEYARQLLTHRNPYTGLELVNDPVMAMVEVINENSLYRMWRDGELKPITLGGQLLYRHSHMLDTMWNSYLKKKYPSAAALAASWDTGITNADTANLIYNGNFEDPFNTSGWIMELHETAQASMQRDSSTKYGGKYSEKITVTNVTGTAWHIQWKNVGFFLKKDSVYMVTFAAKADSSSNINLTLMRDNSPYTYYSGSDFSLDTEWNTYSFTFKSPEDNAGYGRLSFSFYVKGSYWFDDISLKRAIIKGLLPGEDPDSNSVKRIDYSDCPRYSANRVKDMSDFYIKLQTDFFNNMKSYLHDTLGVKVPVVGTNWNIGAGDLISQSVMDYIDNHSYWDHPSFPGIPWSPTDWYIQNLPMVQSSSGGTIPGLFGGVGMKGKPFTISEYNHAYPNIYQTEGVLFLSAYSSFHGVDGIMFFDYEGSENSWSSDYIGGYFDLDRNSAMMALMPSCSYAFRNGLISEAKETVYLDYTRDTVLILPKINSSYAPSYFSQKLALIHDVRNESFNSSSSSNFSELNPQIDPPFITDTKEIEYNTNGLLSVGTKRFIGMSGFLNSFAPEQIKNLTLNGADGFGTLTWLSLTGDSLNVSRKSLLTVSSFQSNTGMVWDGTSTVHDNWGSAPTIISPLSVDLVLNVSADSLKVFPLDERGNKVTGQFYLLKSDNNLFDVKLNQNTDKTLWYGIEAYGVGRIENAAANTHQVAGNYVLEQNYPNPFNPSTIIKYSLPKSGFVSIKVYDILGRETATLVNKNESAGYHTVVFDMRKTINREQLTSGVYFYRMQSGGYAETKKCIYIK